MTHGEELGSEMQQDPIVLTYLEGLLMHQAAGGSVTAVDKLSGRVKAEDNFNISGNVFTNCKNNAPVHNSNQSSGMLHLKKARLLQSSEDWHAAKRRRLSDSINGNGKNESLLAGMVENVPKGKQDSTLLASLLQSFSSRLQSVALSQQIKQSLKDQGFSLNQQGNLEEKDTQCYGLASNHLKTLLNKSRSKDNPLDSNLTGLPKSSIQEKFAEPSLSAQGTNKVVGEPISCAARLQAVANMVEKRSSPAASPKPSVACSQLALLLSSEAHLQQYSREHALKAQSASQLASERLAAMARLKETSEKDFGRLQLPSNVPTSLNAQVKTVTNGLSNAGNISPFPSTLGVPNSPLKTVGYKNHLERSHGKPSPNNSLLLHLLKSQNGASVGKNLSQNEKYSAFDESATPTTTDDCSDNNPSFTEEESSDDESTHSNCVPIDLSFKNRVDKPKMLHSAASIENLTESLLHNWDPKVNGIDISKENKDTVDNSLKPYQKVTLLQLLLGHKTDDPSTIEDLQTQQKATDLTKFSFPAPGPLLESPTIRNSSPLNTLSLHSSSKPDSPMNLTHQPFPVKPPFTSFINNIHPERIINPASSHLIELTRNKALQTTQTTIPLVKENAQNTAFSASKMLQNLAQCGKPTSPSDDQRQSKPVGLANSKPVGLIERLNSPLVTNPSRTFEEGRGFSSPSTPVDPSFSGSEIENLLERRTVLQLLLAAPNSKCKNDKVQKPVIKDEVNTDRTAKSPSEQIVAFKIKTEPEDDVGAGDRETSVPSPLAASLHKTVRPAPEDVRSSHSSPHDFSLSKNGLLSRLLRQNQDGYDISDLNVNNRHSESKQIDSKISCIVPKKRKMHQNDPVESQLKIAKISSPDAGNQRFCTSPSSCESPFLLEDKINGTKTEHDNKNLTGQNSLSGNKNLSWSRESKGFNVLKQLLLSENCVRDSQHRNNTPVDELLRGNRSNLSGNSEFMLPSLNMFMGKHSHQNNLGQMSFQYPSPLKNSPHSSPDILRNNPPWTAESGLVNMCPPPTDKAPIKWVITDMEKNDLGKDSPRLTKTNPILYYMLQKGAHTAASQDLQDRASWTESLLGQAAEMTFKRESAHSRGTNGIGFSKPPNGVNNTLHNSNSSKYGLLDMLTIKKEPE
ncbi:nuclear receptor-interacting protein 1 [Hyla sarda]|uniref:nuclear receptor-interacting protein 1 n=1 Tax=Hyla sarda TaxID=327740 RepID=UPI0024C45D55|nr:nuclear receptor-interacting protein 1 [Hyla sarda]XP_056415368.1 nuclear receptor-interacting protein 1 [Hyla sarda]XP_056415369.1 nuclear receptor-interacting protein 1 [Hyla sarda]XP_056415370.1 nuclear receptor-interacting protein 1 [Hyla sarda]XP_056415372.1 nuclear receptor-interacting protein 1 [Hyla sarda]XP_056415373.1 nuclear receptor-interacting protein 1 [Hyla sarda]XP_056415374.1 nuclear receptor-interacting protein 1 [Hyla sarda]XP_056415375.1 nuclear receptor-interacting pr